MLLDNTETELGSGNQEASPSAHNFSAILHMEVFSITIAGSVDISEVPGCYLLLQMSSQWGSQKLFQGLVPHELPFLFLTYF